MTVIMAKGGSAGASVGASRPGSSVSVDSAHQARCSVRMNDARRLGTAQIHNREKKMQASYRSHWLDRLKLAVLVVCSLASSLALAAFNIPAPFDTAASPAQKGALERGPNNFVCHITPKSEPFKYLDNDAVTGHPYRVYDVYNPGAAACRDITLSWANGDCGDLELGMFIYNGTFNPNDITQNFVGGGFQDDRGKGKFVGVTDASQYRYSPGFDRYGGFLAQDYHTDWLYMSVSIPAYAHLQIVVAAKRKTSDPNLSCATPRLYSDSLALNPVGFTVDDTQSFEGALGDGAKLTFPIRLNAISPATVSVNWSSADGLNPNGGVAGTDYTAASGIATFAPGEDVKYVDVPIIGNSVIQPDRTVRLLLSNPSPAGVSIVRATAAGKIIDDDTPTCRFTAPKTLAKGIVGVDYPAVNFIPTGTDAIGEYTITVHAGSQIPPGLNFSVTDPPGDINAFGVLQGKPTQAGSFTFTLDLVCPLIENGSESYSQTWTMNVEDGLPKVFVSLPDKAMPEGNAGLTPVQMTVSLSSMQQSPTSFSIVTQDASATVADNDYVPQNGQIVTVPAGSLQANFTVNLVGDLKPEGDEPFVVFLYHTVGTKELAASAIVTILNDDVLPPSNNVPTLGEWSLLLLGMLILLIAARHYRRRS